MEALSDSRTTRFIPFSIKFLFDVVCSRTGNEFESERRVENGS